MEHFIENPFIEFAVIIFVCAILGAVGVFLKQPLIVSFIAAGIIIGPSGFNLIQSTDKIHLLSEIGISILLFVVGLKLDISLIKSTGKVALLTGLGQIVFTSIFGFLIAKILNYGPSEAVYIAVALTFSSTIIVVKLLTDKKEIDSLYGQIAIGFLIVQDIVIVIIMIFLSSMESAPNLSPVLKILTILLKGIGIVIFVGLLMKYIFPWLLKKLAISAEMLLLFSISWAVILSAIGETMGFSKEVGAFTAGVSLAPSQYREIISGRLTSLRDFLLLFFFINLGAQLDISLLETQIVPAVIFSIFVLIAKPFIVLLIMGLIGYRKRLTLLAGLTVGQISEFSLILTTMGLSLGHIEHETMGLITLVGLITFGLSTYLIIYSHQIYKLLAPDLIIFERKIAYRSVEENIYKGDPVDVVIFGLGRYGNNIYKSLNRQDLKILGVDFDPKLVSAWQTKGKNAQYADVEDPEITTILPLKNAKYVISTISDLNLNISLLKYLKEADYKGKIALTVHHDEHGEILKKAGADIVLFPFVDAAHNILNKLQKK